LSRQLRSPKTETVMHADSEETTVPTRTEGVSPPLYSYDRTRKWAAAAMYLAAYVILEWVSFIHVHKGVPITPWDPGLGAIFAVMIRSGPAAGMILFGGIVIADFVVLQTDVEGPIVIGIGAITALSFALVVAWARRRLKLDTELVHLRDVLMLLAVGLLGAAIDTIL
jgi:two-component system, LuxR family, sensor kinase FixL